LGNEDNLYALSNLDIQERHFYSVFTLTDYKYKKNILTSKKTFVYSQSQGW